MVLYTLVPFEIGSFMILMIPHYALDHHHRPLTFGEKIVHGLAVFLRILADLFFRERYGHRAVFIETIAAIPGMVGGALLHFRCLRKIKEDEGWIRRLLEEAENERMHLMAFIHIANRFVGYLEEEAIHSYSQYLKKVLIGAIENSPAPTFGIQYWNLKKNARLSDLIISIREDERTHRDVNHYFSDILKKQ